jgi:alpha-tubulin suppressor-like RCC1 family protein
LKSSPRFTDFLSRLARPALWCSIALGLLTLLPPGARAAVPVLDAASPNSGLATAGGTAVTLTGSGFVQTQGMAFTQVAGGTYHTCGIAAADGRVYCWGWNVDSQLGDGSNTDRTTPVAVATAGTPMDGKNIVHIAAGNFHTCAIDDGGLAYCFGNYRLGVIGDSSITGRNAPVAVAAAGTPMDGKNIVHITAGYLHTCAIDGGGLAYCWGWNLYGQLGDGSNTNKNAPVAVATSATPRVGK